MPEIAEVETVRNTLKRMILNKKIKEVTIRYPKIIETDLKTFKKVLEGNTIHDIKRTGKWLIFELDEHYLLSHLRMEGKYFLKNHEEEVLKHEHILFTFTDNTELRYHDTRKFGRMALILKDQLQEYPKIKKLGIEPLDSKLTKEYLYAKLHSKNIAIKTLLLDQTIINGLGNIYADEVLFATKINPHRLGSTITKKECDALCKACQVVITQAIELGGTTIRSYTSSLGVTGRFQQKLKVHKQANMPCKICQTLILKDKIGGRSTYFCPTCQK